MSRDLSKRPTEEARAREEAVQRLSDLCKALDEAQVLADADNHGSVYHFRREFFEIQEQCSTVDYQPWQ